MTEGDVDDQKKENRQEPNKPATVADLKDLGIQYWKMDAESFTYPVKSVPWDPKDAVDPVSFVSFGFWWHFSIYDEVVLMAKGDSLWGFMRNRGFYEIW